MAHPYSNLPDRAYWRRAVADVDPGEIDPVSEPPFQFEASEKVATAGSCFAQHIGRFLKASGCDYLVTEAAHPSIGPAAARVLNYGVYTARYGNVYTSRQLLQLFDRAYGRFTPAENVWRESAALLLDPFRPNIQPGGFNSERELETDRERHFAAVRKAFETLDVFVFTLGLTECWRSREDGAVFPLCPGVKGGRFDPARHEFVNLGVDEVIADMKAFLERLGSVNPRARTILTVSPVPLAATAEPRHVLVSTVYSKSVLRVACDALCRMFGNIAYFPSYEIVAGGFGGRNYFAADRRSVTEDGVAHVMRVFARNFVRDNGAPCAPEGARTPSPETNAVAQAIRLMCEEEALDVTPYAESRAPDARDKK